MTNKGFIRINTEDFEAFNYSALSKYIQETGDVSCTVYTIPLPDVDIEKVWVKIEHANITTETLVSKEEAIELGMLEEVGSE